MVTLEITKREPVQVLVLSWLMPTWETAHSPYTVRIRNSQPVPSLSSCSRCIYIEKDLIHRDSPLFIVISISSGAYSHECSQMRGHYCRLTESVASHRGPIGPRWLGIGERLSLSKLRTFFQNLKSCWVFGMLIQTCSGSNYTPWHKQYRQDMLLNLKPWINIRIFPLFSEFAQFNCPVTYCHHDLSNAPSNKLMLV